MATARSPGELSEMVERRAAGLPLEQVLGWAEFCGLRIAVDPWVFVPRRRTEFLVQEAVALLARGGGPAGLAACGGGPRSLRQDVARPEAIVVDLCCGAGPVGASLASAVVH